MTGKPDLEDVEPVKPPTVDPDMYYGIAGEIVQATAPTTEADPAGVLASLLSGISVIIGPETYVQIGNSRHPLLIWPLLFGRTGSGRKGEAGETAGVFLFHACVDWPEIAVTGLSSGEGLIERIRDRDPHDDRDQGGTEDKRLAITEPEFASVMARAKREGSTLGYVLREAWAGKPLSVLNRRALHASRSHVGITGHITPREFRIKLAEADMAGGTFNRFLPIYVERSRKIPIPEGVGTDDKLRLGSKLISAIGQAKDRGPIGLTASATRLWSDELYDEFTEADDDDAAWTQFARRAAPYCRRIAALYAALDGRDRAHRDDLYAAAAMVRYSSATAKYVLAAQISDPKRDRLMRALDTAGPTGLSRTQISHLFSRKLTAKALDMLLDELIDTGGYEQYSLATGGRSAEMYRQAKEAKEAN